MAKLRPMAAMPKTGLGMSAQARAAIGDRCDFPSVPSFANHVVIDCHGITVDLLEGSVPLMPMFLRRGGTPKNLSPYGLSPRILREIS